MVLWSVSTMQLPFVSVPDSLTASNVNTNAPDHFHMKANTTSLFDMQDSWDGLDFQIPVSKGTAVC